MTGPRRPRATILGCEYAGEIVAAGGDVTNVAVGDRVFGYNEGPFGAHAEYLAVAADGPLAPVPEGMAFLEAAPGTEGSHYAWAFLRKARVRAGQDVLVNGATGAIGCSRRAVVAQPRRSGDRRVRGGARGHRAGPRR